jgi:hypothetical protein
MRRLSATTAFAPPGPMILARVVNRCMRSTIKSFMGNRVGQAAMRRKVYQVPVFTREVIIRHTQVCNR